MIIKIFIAVLTFTTTLLSAKRTKSNIRKGPQKDINTIAVFSEDDISEKLPSPEAIAKEIPETLIDLESKKIKSISFKGNENRKKNRNENKNKSKRNKKYSDESDHDRKSKLVKEKEDDDSISETDQVVDAEPSITLTSTLNILRTESVITVTETIPVEAARIQSYVEVTPIKNDDYEVKTPSNFRSKRFIQRKRQYQANSSSNKINNNNVLTVFLTVLLIIFA